MRMPDIDPFEGRWVVERLEGWLAWICPPLLTSRRTNMHAHLDQVRTVRRPLVPHFTFY